MIVSWSHIFVCFFFFLLFVVFFFFFQAEDGIRDFCLSRGLGDVYKRQAVQTGSIKSQLENPDLKWETTTELNVGLDFGFLNNRITGSFEYFHKVVSDLLAFRKLNSLMEVSTIADNIGATQSTGYEFSLNTVNLTGPFKWNTTLNISCLLYTSPSPRDRQKSRMPSSA